MKEGSPEWVAAVRAECLRVLVMRGELAEGGDVDRMLAWRDGDLEFKLHASQLEVDRRIQSSSFSREVLEISRKWGKTYYLLYRAARICIKKPGARVVYGAPTYKHLREFILPVIDDFFADAPKSVKPTFHQDSGHLQFPNGSWVHLFGADDKGAADRGRGPSAEEAIFDEAGFCPVLGYVVRSVFRPSLLLTGGKTILSSTPAPEPEHEFTTMAERAEAIGSYSHRDIHSNPLLTKQQIADFIEADARDEGLTVEQYMATSEFQREYLAKRVVDKMLVVMGNDWELSEARAVRETPRPQYFDAYGALDIGGADPHAHVFGYYDFRAGTLVIEDEILMREGQNTAELAVAVKEKEHALWGNDLHNGRLRAELDGQLLSNLPDWVRINLAGEDAPPQPYLRIADNDLLVVRDLLDLHGLLYIPTLKDDKELQVNNLRVLVRQGKLVIHPRCQHTVRHLRGTIWENEKRLRYRRRAGEHGDLLDCLVYLARNVSWRRNPWPEEQPSVSVHVSQKYHQPTQQSEIARAFSSQFALRNAGKRRHANRF